MNDWLVIMVVFLVLDFVAIFMLRKAFIVGTLVGLFGVIVGLAAALTNGFSVSAVQGWFVLILRIGFLSGMILLSLIMVSVGMRCKVKFFVWFVFLLLFLSSFSFVVPVRASVSSEWYGIGTDWKVYADQSGSPASIATVLSRWEGEVALMHQYGLNTVRLAVSMANSGSTYHSKIVFSEFHQVVDYLESEGIGVVVDLHDWRDMYGLFGSASWVSDWVDFADEFKDESNILAYELFNEPFYENWVAGMSGSGAGHYDGSEEVAAALADCYDAIRAAGDEHLVIYPDLWFWRGVAGYQSVNYPQDFINNAAICRDVVITSHDYCSTGQHLDTVDIYVSERKMRLQRWIDAGFDVWCGEFGTEINPVSEGVFVWRWINAALSLNSGFSFWMHGYSSRAAAWETLIDGLEASDFYNYVPFPSPYPSASASPTASPSPNVSGSVPVGDYDLSGGMFDEGLITFVMCLMYVFVPAVLLLVSFPKVGAAGFMLVIVGSSLVGVVFFGLPFYFLLFAGLGVAVLFLGMVRRG